MDSSAPKLERKLVTILSADVVGYSKLMAEDEETTLFTFRGHKSIFEREITAHGGRIFNTAGDAILAEYPSAVEGVRCAIKIQMAIREQNANLKFGKPVRFRMGINLGDVIIQGTDLLGDGVNIAARLQAGAEPGGICISGSVFDQIQKKLPTQVQYLGSKTYKNIPDPVRTYAITEEGMRSNTARTENTRFTVTPPPVPSKMEKTGSIINLDLQNTKAAEINIPKEAPTKKIRAVKTKKQEAEIEFDPTVLDEARKPDLIDSQSRDSMRKINLNAKIQMADQPPIRKQDEDEDDEYDEEKGFLSKIVGKIFGK